MTGLVEGTNGALVWDTGGNVPEGESTGKAVGIMGAVGVNPFERTGFEGDEGSEGATIDTGAEVSKPRNPD